MSRDGRRIQLVFCGLGGQGILFLTRVLAEAAMLEGREVLTSETHGMAQRGGAVESHVKIGGFQGSLVRRGQADAVLALDESRITAARDFLREGGRCFAGAAASAMARQIGSPRAANLILLGLAAASAPECFPAPDKILSTLERLSPRGTSEVNRKAFLMGRDLR